MSKIVKLVSSELKVSVDIGTQRFLNNVRKSRIANHMSKGDPVECEITSYRGELAVAKALNLFPDLTTFNRTGGYDLVTQDGLRIDVKTTSYKNGNLVINSKKDPTQSDVYVLVRALAPNAYEIVGWEYTSIVHSDIYWTDSLKSKGGGWFVPADHLKSINSLLKKEEDNNGEEKEESNEGH